MGNAQVSRVDEPRLLLTDYGDLAYQDVLGSYKLFKVMKCVHEREGLVLVKLFIQRDGAPDLKDVQHRILQVKDAFRSQWLHPNVVPYQGMEITAQSAILLRPHFARDLYDRMHTRPFLSELMKNWIAFQVLCSVCQAHSMGVVHGDLKTENIFVSSWNHAILSDFAGFKPLRLPEDDPSEFSFFFESDLNRRRCYLAPERFDTTSGRAGSHIMREPFSRELAAMDVFSLGCVLAELFLDGQTLMDLPELLRYRSNQLDLHAKISCIKNRAVQELLGSMLHRDPAQRRPAIGYLRDWCTRVAPRSFCGCLFPLSVLMLHPMYQQPDMRIALIRGNFANILWCLVGPSRISKALGLASDTSADVGQGHANLPIWHAWLRHVEKHVRSTDEAMLHGTVHVAVQAASQWAEAPAGNFAADAVAAADLDECTASEYSARQQGSSSSGASKQAAGTSPRGPQGMSPRLAHPWLREFACDGFAQALFDHWEEGYKRCAASGRIGTGEIENSPIYASFLADLCNHSPGRQGGEEAELPGPGAQPGTREDEDVLSIVCGFVCSSLQHLSHPRMRIICLDMFEQIASFTSQHTVLEQIVPYCHLLMTDPTARVRARAISVLTCALGRVEELPPGDTPLFMEYIFPQLMSAMSGMSGEPVVLLAIAGNIGALARHAVGFAELSVAVAQRGADNEAAPSRDSTGGAARGVAEQTSPKRSTDAAVEVEAFDVQCKHLREAVKRIVKALLECLPAGPQQQQAAERAGPRADVGEGHTGAHEESLLNLAAGREVKIALLRNTCILADSFGREDTHNFLLPYLISFMNDPAWEVRAAFCEEAALLPKKVGQVSTEGIIWPCYEQALLDQEERVLQAALSGLKTLASQRVLRRQSLVTVASKIAPLLVHPSAQIRRCTVDVFSALGEQLSAVDQYVFVMPAVRPLLKLELLGLEAMSPAFLATPLGRRTFKRALLRRDEELHEALLHKKPLPRPSSSPPVEATGEDVTAPGSGAGDGDEELSYAALDLLRPYLQLLLRSRPTIAQMSGAGPNFGDERGTRALPSALVQGLQYFAVNPHCAPNRSLQARALSEFDSSSAWLQVAVQGSRAHPLGLFSAQAFLAQALCLPPRPRDLGALNYLDGTPYSLYAATSTDASVDLRSQSRSEVTLGGQDSVLGLKDSIVKSKDLDLCESPDPSVDAAAMTTSSERRASSLDGGWRRTRAAEDGFQAVGMEAERRSGSHHAPWRPQGVLLATLYEYAHQSGVPVVKVDTTDDSRILVTGGKDGVVKLWNCAQLERDVAVSSTHTFAAPCDVSRRRQKLRTLRTVRNAKAVAVGTEAGEVFLYKIVPSRGSATAMQVCHFAAGEQAGSCAVMCIEQFDNELESLVVFAQQHGAIQGWDIRSRSPCWSGLSVPPWLGVPSCLALANDGHALVAGSLGGGLVLYDLRFLAPWKQWRVSSGAAVLALRGANFRPSPGVFAALGGDSNEVALFDVSRGSCQTFFLTEPAVDRQKEAAISVPTLLQVHPQTAMETCISPDSVSGGWHSAGCVRSLWLPPRGAQTFLLAGGTDRKVRHWSLDPEHHAAETYVVTPPDPLGSANRSRDHTAYSSNHLGDVFVVQEQSVPRGTTSKSPGPTTPASDPEDGRPRGPNPNHRDAILDMCSISLQQDILVTAGRDGLVKLWK